MTHSERIVRLRRKARRLAPPADRRAALLELARLHRGPRRWLYLCRANMIKL